MAETKPSRSDDRALSEQSPKPGARASTLAFVIAVTLIVLASVAAILVALMSYRNSTGLGVDDSLGLPHGPRHVHESPYR